jgi:hypothetical protein
VGAGWRRAILVEDAETAAIRQLTSRSPTDMTACHDAAGLRPEDSLVSAIPVAELHPAASTIYCVGSVHAESGQPALLDMLAKRGPSRVALMEDGAAFCGSCAQEVYRGRDDPQ